MTEGLAFHKNMEFLWNFWGCFLEKAQNMEFVIMENVYIVKTKIQINILTLTFLQIVI